MEALATLSQQWPNVTVTSDRRLLFIPFSSFPIAMSDTAVAVVGSKLPDGVRPGVATGQRVTRLLEYAKCNQFGECAEEATFASLLLFPVGFKGSRRFQDNIATHALARIGGWRR